MACHSGPWRWAPRLDLAATLVGSVCICAYTLVGRILARPRIAPVMARVSPLDTAAEPSVRRSVCGVTPANLARLIAFGQTRFVPWQKDVPASDGNTNATPFSRGVVCKIATTGAASGRTDLPVLEALSRRHPCWKSTSLHFKAAISWRDQVLLRSSSADSRAYGQRRWWRRRVGASRRWAYNGP